MMPWQTLIGNIRRPPLLIWVVGVCVAIIALIPALYTVIRATEAIGDTTLPPPQMLQSLIINTVLLASATACLSGVIGMSQALLIERTILFGRSFWRVIAALPLAIPPYVLGICVLALFRPRGIIEKWLHTVIAMPYDTLPFHGLFGVWGSAVVLALSISPYVYLPVAAVLRQGSNHLSEMAQLSGTKWYTQLRHVTLPIIAPAAGSGMLLCMLYALADFGVPALLRLPTFSTAIYGQFTGQINRGGAALLSLPLILVTIILIIIEERLAGRGGVQINRSWRPYLPHALGYWQWLAQWGLSMVSVVAVGLPFGMLLFWASKAPSASNIDWATLIQTGARNLLFVTMVASITTCLAIGPALLVRRGGLIGIILTRCSQAGYALPGVVVALSVVLVVNRGFSLLAGSLIPLILAYMIRFLPQAVQSLDATFMQIAPSIEEAGHSLGRTATSVLKRIMIPLATPGIRAGWALLFLSMIKELPATLLLRPAGFDTLAVRIWMPASDGHFLEAAYPALLLIMAALLPLTLILSPSQHASKPPHEDTPWTQS
ncbi:MAG: iron ABC transporter permease [Chloroflexia bacterium]|nr:iron ABC transporter permease [Chloroflexia bacterium]